MDKKILARVNVKARPQMIRPLTQFVGEVASLIGFEGEERRRIELLVEEAGLYIIETVFEPEEEGEFDIIISYGSQGIMLAFESKGLPLDVDKLQRGEITSLPLSLIRAFADQVRFQNLGRHGTRIEVVKGLPSLSIVDMFPEEKEGSPSKEVPLAPEHEEVKLRMMRPDDAVGLARCMYRSYGYSYLHDFVYYPSKTKALIESGLIKSCVAINPKGEVVGHVALGLSELGAKVGESKAAVVDPRYRGRGLFKKMKLFLAKETGKQGMYGFYSEAVTIHPYTQKGNLAMGAHETGLLIAYIPETILFKKTIKKQQKSRQTAILYYLKIQEEPFRKVFAPEHHRDILREIFEINNLNRGFETYSDTIELDEQETLLDIIVSPEAEVAFLTIKQFGKDVVQVIRHRLKELCLEKIECIYLDLPLSDPYTAVVCGEMEEMGFFFAGIIPEFYQGDILRLQYLNNVKFDPKEIMVVSEFGKTLLEYVMECIRKTGIVQ